MKYYITKIRLLSSLIMSCISIMGLSQTVPAQKFHDTKGNIEVTQAGQLQYTLTIDTPPGVQKTAPNINLVYVSGAGNGLAGYGWNISGLTAISRVGKNLEKDGVTKNVQLDYSDYYSLNGQRLILKSGEYGKDGAEYVTEKYSNMKIKSVGSISGQSWQGPEYWEVTSPDGSQAWYGATASGNSSARSPIDYNIAKTKDVNGNYITYNYTSDGNVSVIKSIEWGGNETQNTPHFNKIEFVFGARPQPEIAYIKGVEISQSKLLQSIVVSSGSQQYKKYNISYKADVQNTAYRYPDKISILNSKNEEANPVLFTYEKKIGPWENNVLNIAESMSLRPNPDHDILGDFDGDGNLDILRHHTITSSLIPQVGLYLYSNFYKNYYQASNPPIFVGSSVSGVKGAVPINLKKENRIRNRQGFVIKKSIYNPSTSKSDLELSFYSLTESNQLILEFTKFINGSDISTGNITTIGELKAVDLNGDGLNELILPISGLTCPPVNDDPNNRPPGCRDSKRYFVIDLDESLQNGEWFYPILLHSDFLNTNQNVFTTHKLGDFDGDGIVDLLKIDENKNPHLLTFSKNTQGQYEANTAPFSNPTNIVPINGSWADGLVGDFNGDGLSDIVTSGTGNSWYLYISKGNGFKEESFNFVSLRKDRTVDKDLNNNISIDNPRTFLTYDVNNDGKTDLVCLESQRRYRKDFIQDNNQATRYQRTYYVIGRVFSISRGNPNWYAGTYGDSDEICYLNGNNVDQELAPNSRDMMGLAIDQSTAAMLKQIVVASAVGAYSSFNEEQKIGLMDYFDISSNARIKSISQGAVTTDIVFKQLDKSKNPGLYDAAKIENYPYVEIGQAPGIYVVSGMIQTISTDKKLKQDFRYRGLTSNILGRGLVGFRKMARSSWYADGFEATKIWSGIETDPTNEGIPVKEWSIRTNDETKVFPTEVSENNNQLLSAKFTTYQIDKLLNGQVVTNVPDADKGKVVTAIVPKTIKTKDFLTGVVSEDNITYGQYYLPSVFSTSVNGNYGLSTKKFRYSNNPSGQGKDYYIGRITDVYNEKAAYSDTQVIDEYYEYQNNRIKTVTMTPKADPDRTMIDEFTYDGFGNIISKVTSSLFDNERQTEKNQYDSKGRFVIKKTDNLGLETTFTYNDWGQILTQTDPFSNSITNAYDDWGKLMNSTSNLDGTTVYTYEKDNNSNVTVIKNEPDGNISKVFTNKFGQQYKSVTKAFGQGQYVAKETLYDALGRKIKESEPYFEGQTASQWNTIVYDDSVFPAKVTATAYTGKKTETLISGLTTKVTETNPLDYGRVTSKTADALGNIVSTTDKGGTIQFSYNAAGKQIQAKYAENLVTTKYDVWGRKIEFNDPSNGIYKYEYNGLGQTGIITSPKGNKEYLYNSLGQLITQREFSTVDAGQTTNKTITFTYNNKGQLTEKSGTVKGLAFSTVLTYDPQGRLLSSTENSNGRTYTQKGITYDDKGRPVSYEKELQSSGILTKASVENIYSPWNGELYQIKDKTTGKVLWELKESNAKDQVLQAKLGAAEITNVYDPNGFLMNINHSSAVKPDILKVSYSFDAIKNELKNKTTILSGTIDESFDYDDNNRLVNWSDPVLGDKPAANRNIYDVKGRIMENDQVGVMKYENSAKIYRPTGMTLNAAGKENYAYDLIQSIVYNENNDPVFIDGQIGDVAFQYGLTGMRQKVTYGGAFGSNEQGAFTKFYSEDGSFEVVKDNAAGTEKHLLYIGGTPYESNIVYLKNYSESNGSYKFLHKDYIGSILAITDEAGSRVEVRHFDAWGNLTHLHSANGKLAKDKLSILSYIQAFGGLLVDRGYTGHEHFMEVGIIHMNGRLYDPLLRRFLNADENIQDPANTQNYNKYGYVMNNPLMYNDLDGEFWMYLAGALVGGYLNGVQANNGNWNPGKWDWQRTWSAVLGGAIGGAAVSGALGNIASNAGAIKNFLPGIVSGGLNSAFNGGNFLGGAIGGLSYSGNLFTNKVTSTDGINAGYKYVISPDYNDDGETEHYFQMADFAQYGASEGIKPPFDKSEVGQLASAGIISAVTARVLMGAIGAEIAGAGVIGAGGSITWSSAAGAGINLLARTFALGLLLSVRGDSSGPPKAYVYTIMGHSDIAKFGVTRAKDPNGRPERQISGLNSRYVDDGPHSWMYLHEGVSANEAFLFEKYYVWQYWQAHNKMPYAQRYPYEDAVTRFLYKYLKIK